MQTQISSQLQAVLAASIRFANGRIVPSLPKYMMHPAVGLDWRSDSAARPRVGAMCILPQLRVER